jgi:hypothetical protein
MLLTGDTFRRQVGIGGYRTLHDGSEVHNNALRWALVHDGSEAFLIDVPRPVKRDPRMAFYLEAEARVMAVMAEALGLSETMPDVVKQADEDALALELFLLFPESHEPTGRDHVEALFERVALDDRMSVTLFHEMMPREAEQLFMATAASLGWDVALRREAAEQRDARRARRVGL